MVSKLVVVLKYSYFIGGAHGDLINRVAPLISFPFIIFSLTRINCRDILSELWLNFEAIEKHFFFLKRLVVRIFLSICSIPEDKMRLCSLLSRVWWWSSRFDSKTIDSTSYSIHHDFFFPTTRRFPLLHIHFILVYRKYLNKTLEDEGTRCCLVCRSASERRNQLHIEGVSAGGGDCLRRWESIPKASFKSNYI